MYEVLSGKITYLAILLATIPALAGCSDSMPASEPLGPVLRAERGIVASSEEETLRALTRNIAMALQDRALRTRILNDLRNSRFTEEHKLELASYLRGESAGVLLEKISSVTGQSREDLLLLLSSIRPMEFYMPSSVHRGLWRGGDDLLVASLLKDQTASTHSDPGCGAGRDRLHQTA